MSSAAEGTWLVPATARLEAGALAVQEIGRGQHSSLNLHMHPDLGPCMPLRTWMQGTRSSTTPSQKQIPGHKLLLVATMLVCMLDLTLWALELGQSMPGR